MSVIVETILYVIFDLILVGIASILLPLLTLGRVRVAAADAPGAFPLHGFRRGEDGRLELGRSHTGKYALVILLLILAFWLSFAAR
ncbi:hypothetical protein [Phreatobacter sp.]|uniref:hypothetical protein n=1 Tax=Phreatobacter sp. TaxID=1966341 RepID=UPI003F7226DF